MKNTGFIVAIAATIVIGIIGLVWLRSRPPAERFAPSPTVSAEVLARGETLYQSCAVCHGAEGQGYGNSLNAPALDDSEHAWHHPDEQIIGLIRNGGQLMPAIGAEWDIEDIEAVMTYFKQWWTPQQRASQAGTIGE